MSKDARKALMIAKGPLSSGYLPPGHPEREANLAKFMEGSAAPSVLYHGTNVHDAPIGSNDRPLGDIEKFDRHAAFKAFNRPEGMDAVGTWLDESPGEKGAGMYAGLEGAVYPVHASLKNPWKPKSFDEFLDLMHTTAGRDPKTQRPKGRGTVGPLRDYLISKGHDSIMFPPGAVDHPNQGPVWVSLHPESQLKSAVGNRGTFDPSDPDITKAEGGGVGNARNSAFQALARAQRGDPEIAMVHAQQSLGKLNKNGASVLGSLLEHVGDLTHRMSQYPQHQPSLALENIPPKVKKALHALRPYTMDRMDMQDHVPADMPELKAYADAHASLPVHNDMQRHARDAAVALGNKDFDAAHDHLSKLHEAISDGSFGDRAMEFNQPITKAEGGEVEQTIPEAPHTLAAQLQAFLDGKRKAVLYTHTEPPLPEGAKRLESEHGVFHYNPALIDEPEIRDAIAKDRINDVLGIGPYSKKDVMNRVAGGEDALAVVGRDAGGREVLTAAGTPGTIREQAAAIAPQLPPGGQVRAESPANVLFERIAAMRSAGQGDKDARKAMMIAKAKGGSIEDEAIKAALKRVASPFSRDPEMRQHAHRIASSLKVPQGSEVGVGSYYGVKQPVDVRDIEATVGAIPGVNPLQPKKMSWEDFHKIGKGGTLINIGGDRSNLGRLTHIQGKPLAWPVDLHAGPGYMLEPNPGQVWANNPSHASALKKKIQQAAEKGPVFGAYAPMGSQAVDSSHNMFDALMAQVPGSGISKKAAKEFDQAVRTGQHVKGNAEKDIAKRNSAVEYLQDWPGILNAKAASEFAKTIPGGHRSDIVKFMDSKKWRDEGFPGVGMTRVAITDPDVRGAAGNMLGHRIVQFSPDDFSEKNQTFQHSTYTSPTTGSYVGDVPLVQRQYAMPDVTENMLLKPAAGDRIIHPYSVDPLGRSTARKLFEEQKQLQPINQRMLDSIQQGLENKQEYGFAAGGTVDGVPDRELDQSGFYNAAVEAAQSIPQAKGTPQQMLSMVQNAPGTQETMKWSKSSNAFAGQPIVSKDDLVKHFQTNAPKLEETQFGGKQPDMPTKYHKYTIRGGENYREVLLKTPVANNVNENNYNNSHWTGHPNVVAHLRMSDRTLPQTGEKALHLEELQSDWGQAGREGFKKSPEELASMKDDMLAAHKNFLDLNNRWSGATEDQIQAAEDKYNAAMDKWSSAAKVTTPEGPYVGNTAKWTELGLKRALIEAARGGHDKLVWTPGEDQADRYDLSKQVRHIDYVKHGPDEYRLGIVDKDGEGVHLPKDIYKASELPNVVGKEVANKIINGEGQAGGNRMTLRGLDLKVGGEGMKGYYDKIVPNALAKIVKSIGHTPEFGTDYIKVKPYEADLDIYKHAVTGKYHVATGDKRDAPDAEDIETGPFDTHGEAVAHRDMLYKGLKAVPSLKITPKMRETISKGLPRKTGGFVPPAKSSAVEQALKLTSKFGATLPAAVAIARQHQPGRRN